MSFHTLNILQPATSLESTHIDAKLVTYRNWEISISFEDEISFYSHSTKEFSMYFHTTWKTARTLSSVWIDLHFDENISQWRHTWISHKYTGSIKRGEAVIAQAYRQRRVVGMIWPPPLWIASAWRVTSWMLKRTARKFSSANTPCNHD